MALYNELPIFKATYDLLMIFYRDMAKMPRDGKYTILQEVKNEAMRLEVLIYQANSTRNKLPSLEEAAAILVSLKLKVRIMADLKFISDKLYAMTADKLVEISKQLKAWQKYAKDVSSQ